MLLDWINNLGLLQHDPESNVLLGFPANIRKVLISEVTNYLFQSSAAYSGLSTTSSPSTTPLTINSGAYPVASAVASSTCCMEGIASLTTPFHVKWVMEIVGQAFALPLEDIAVTGHAASIYIQWLVDPSKRPPVIQQGDHAQQQQFIQTILRQLSLLFQARKMEAVGAAKPLLATYASKHVELCKLILKTLLQVAVAPSQGSNQDPLSATSWKVLLRMLLGVTDYLLKMPLQPYCYLVEEIGEQLLSTLMELWMRSQVFSASLWDNLRRLYPGWCHRQLAVSQWSALSLALTQRVSKIIYGQGTQAIVYTVHSNLITLEVSDRFAVFAWHQTLQLIGRPENLSPPIYHRAVIGMDKLVQVFHSLSIVDAQGDVTQGDVNGASLDRILPDGNTILNVFGGWLFDAVARSGPECVDGRAQALGVLCRIFGRPQRRNPFLPTYLHQFYAALLDGLQGDPLCLVFIIINSEDIFTLGLPGVRILTAPFVMALRRLLPITEKQLRVTLNMDDLRRACYKLLCTIFGFCEHFSSAPIQVPLQLQQQQQQQQFQSISMSSVDKAVDAISGSLSQKLSGIYGATSSSSSSSATMRSVRLWIMEMLFGSLVAERDSNNLRYLINTLTAFAMDDAQNYAGIVPFLINQLLDQLTAPSGKWNVDVSLVALEAIRQLAIFDSPSAIGGLYERLIPSLCSFVDGLVGKNNLPAYYRLLTASIDCLLYWTIGQNYAASWLKSSEQCQQVLVQTLTHIIAYGRSISKKVDVVREPSAPLPDGRSKKSLSTSPSASMSIAPSHSATYITAPSTPKSLEYQLALHAEIALAKLLSFLGLGTVNPFTPSHLSTLLNEAILLSPDSAGSQGMSFIAGKPHSVHSLTKEQQEKLCYFILNDNTVVCFINNNTSRSDNNSGDMIVLVRSLVGRFSWEASLLYSLNKTATSSVTPATTVIEDEELPKNHLNMRQSASSLNDLFALDHLLADSFEKQSLLIQTRPELRSFPVHYDEVCMVFNDALVKGRLERDERKKANFYCIEGLTRDQILRCRSVQVSKGHALRSIRATPPTPKNGDTDKAGKTGEEGHQARLLLSHLGLSMLPHRDAALHVPVCAELLADLEILDRMPERELATCAVWYVPSCRQSLEEIILSPHSAQSPHSSHRPNHGEGSSYREEFLHFIHSLGWPVDLRKHAGFDGGLTAEVCPTIPYYANNEVEMVYHVPQLMNFEEVAKLSQQSVPIALAPGVEGQDADYINGLYSLMSDDLVSIVWTEDAQEVLSLPAKMMTRSIVYICVSPMGDGQAPSGGLYRIRIIITSPASAIMVAAHTHDAHPAPAPSTHTAANTNSTHQASSESIFLFGPLLDGMVVRREVLGRLVRETAISASFFCLYNLQGQPKPGVKRAQVLEKLIQKYRQSVSPSRYYDDLLYNV